MSAPEAPLIQPALEVLTEIRLLTRAPAKASGTSGGGS